MSQIVGDRKYADYLSSQLAAVTASASQSACATEMECLVPSPKQNGDGSLDRAGWYPYYAGYSPGFVRAVLHRCNLGTEAVVLDPWNGAGTTTQVANDLGYGTVGFDLNPAMVLVARARLLEQHQIPSLRQVLDDILQAAKSYRKRTYNSDDPLGLWLTVDSVREVRHFERAIRHVLVTETGTGQIEIDKIDTRSSFAYLLLFRALRHSLTAFKASNPAWLKTAKCERELISITQANIRELFCRYFSLLLDPCDMDLFRASETAESKRNAATIEVADSVHLPLGSDAADIVISSPPYCTRIDYAVATSVELAVLGFDPRGSLKALRNRMIGTSTIRPVPPAREERWGATCNRLLDSIFQHRSKASKSYY
jgi:hypothetical protein